MANMLKCTLSILFIFFLSSYASFAEEGKAEDDKEKQLPLSVEIVPVDNGSLDSEFKSNEKISFKAIVSGGSGSYRTLEWTNYKGSPFANSKGGNVTYNRGEQNVSVFVCDKYDAKNCAADTYTFLVTNSPPEKPIIYMSPKSELNRSTKILFGRSFENDADNDKVIFEWKVNDGNWQDSVPYKTWSIGKHSVSVRAIDEYGAVSEISVTEFEIKNSAPTTPRIFMSPKGDVTSDTPIDLSAASSDIDWDSFSIFWKINNSEWKKENPSGHFSEGKYEIRAKAVDEHGNESNITKIHFSVTNTPPSKPNIYLNDINVDEIYSFTPVSFKVDGSIDYDQDEIRYEWKLNDGKWSDKKFKYNLSRGKHVFYARAVDSKGNYSSVSSFPFTVKNSLPSEPTLSYNPKDNMNNRIPIQFEADGSIDLDKKDEITYEWKLDDDEWSSKNPSGLLQGGDRIICVRAKDSYGGYSEDVCEVISIEMLAPNTSSIIELSPNDKRLTSSTHISFSIPNLELKKYDLIYEWKTNSNPWSTESPDGLFKEGDNTVYFRIKDRQGNTSPTSSIQFFIENSAPVIEKIIISSNTGEEFLTDSLLYFSAETSDADNDKLKVYWKLNDGEWVDKLPSQTLDKGEHTVYAKAVDSKNESKIMEKKFIVTEKKEIVEWFEDFEDDSFTFETNGDWIRSNWQSFQQTFSYSTPIIEDNMISSSEIHFEIPADAENALLQFHYLVRTDSSDLLNIYLNDEQIVTDSGFGNWKKYEDILESGDYTLRFEYMKDETGQKYDDAAFIDYLKITYEI